MIVFLPTIRSAVPYLRLILYVCLCVCVCTHFSSHTCSFVTPRGFDLVFGYILSFFFHFTSPPPPSLSLFFDSARVYVKTKRVCSFSPPQRGKEREREAVPGDHTRLVYAASVLPMRFFMCSKHTYQKRRRIVFSQSFFLFVAFQNKKRGKTLFILV